MSGNGANIETGLKKGENCSGTASRFCDLVMKGGITSGVVYPRAVTTLAEKFKFKNIGGTSAGAIAAAAAAAAELGRQQGGFNRLKGLPDFLSAGSASGTGTNLLGFFQPQPKTRSLFRLGLAYLDEGFCELLAVALCEHVLSVMVSALPALLLFTVAVKNASGWFLAICMMAALLLLVLSVAVGLIIAIGAQVVTALPSNFYGICTGMAGTPEKNRSSKALTPWLADYLNELAGRPLNGAPLTFEHLWGTRDPEAARLINLEMMTTNLTHGRPYRLPFRDDDAVKENGMFFFKQEDFLKFFPPEIVKWMIDHPRPLGEAKNASRRAEMAQNGYYPMPSPADLPVVVAVRMSLSFPILLSAVPLYAFDYSRGPKSFCPERCWFSDGGICSNFPVHFFDSPLPRWPTLSLDLVEKPEGTPSSQLKIPEMVQRNSDGIRENWNRFEYEERMESDGKTILSTEKSGGGKLLGFVWAIVGTMQNWSDNTQSHLPGYRDRIAHVGLTPEEGGLNLNMPAGRITNLTERGQKAGEELVSRFGFPPIHKEMNWANHRWLRLRSMLSSIEEMLKKLEKSCSEPQPGDPAYEQWIKQTASQKPPSYPWCNTAQRESAQQALSNLRHLAGKLIQSDQEGNSLSEDAPSPKPELRVRSRI